MKKNISILLTVPLLIVLSMGCISNENEKNGIEINEYYINYSECIYMINETGYTIEDNSTIFLKNITHVNITSIRFSLKWNDTHTWPPKEITRIYVPYVPEPDTFNLSIKEPRGANVYYTPNSYLESTQYNGLINVTADLNNMPENTTYKAKSQQDVINQTILHNGKGIWKINITCIDAPGTGSGGIVGPGYDMGNNWELNISIHFYKANISKPS